MNQRLKEKQSFRRSLAIPAKAENVWKVYYGKVTPLLVKAIQDQQATIETKEKKLMRGKRWWRPI